MDGHPITPHQRLLSVAEILSRVVDRRLREQRLGRALPGLELDGECRPDRLKPGALDVPPRGTGSSEKEPMS